MKDITGKKALCLAIIAGILNIIPWYFLKPGDDTYDHYSIISCFDWQFWHGNLRPDWCMHANGGLGSPLPLFYFPLSYYITTFLHPLRFFGLTSEHIYVASLLLASTVSFYTCWLWLADCFNRKVALLGATVFLVMPYRSELLFFRSAYTEIWGFAFIPLLLLALRRATIRQGQWLHVSAATALCLATHVPATLIALIGGGIRLVVSGGGRNKEDILYFILAMLLAASLLAVYVIPAQYFLSALDPENFKKADKIWANRFIQWEDWEGFLLRCLLPAAITWATCAGLSFCIWKKRNTISDRAIRTETMAWIATACSGFFLLFSISHPVWSLLHIIGPVLTPWRMQQLIMFAVIYLFGTYATWCMSPKQQKTQKFDFVAAMIFLIVLSLSMLNVRREESEELNKQVENVQIILAQNYKTLWTDDEHNNMEYIGRRSSENSQHPLVEITQGQGSIENIRMEAKTIHFAIDLTRTSRIRIQHWYFPTWYARIDGVDMPVIPEEKSGEMLIDIPKGKHDVELYRDILKTIPNLYRLSECLSLAALIIFICMFYRQRRFILTSKC